MALEDFFTWGSGGRKMTPDQLAAERQALAVMQAREGDTSPVAHWSQGLGRVVNALAGNYRESKADKAEAAGIAQGQAAMDPVLAALMGGGSGGGYTAGGGASSAAAPEDALGLIREFEGFRETPYWDVNAYRTGYGSDTITMPDGSVVPVAQGMSVSRDDAERDLSRRVGTEFIPRAQEAVGPDVWAALNPQQQSSLASITYNYGSLPSSVAAAVQTPGIEDDVAAIRGLATHNGGINAGRRNREADIYGGVAGMGGQPQTTVSTQGKPSAGGDIISLLMAAQADPWARKQYGPVIDALMGSELSTRAQAQDPMYQLGLQKAQMEVDAMRNPGAPAPIEVNGQLIDPRTGAVMGDYRTADAPDPFAGTKLIGDSLVAPDGQGGFAPVYTPPANPEAPTTKQVKLSDGSEVMVQWNPQTQNWDAAPIPQGGTPGVPPKKLTESQAKMTLFKTLQDKTMPVLNQLETQFDPANLSDPTLAKIPIAGNYFTSPEYQIYKTAAAAWAEGALRISTGAAATQPEIDRLIATYFAMPGDTPETVAFKSQMRDMYSGAVNNALSDPDPGAALALPGAPDADFPDDLTPAEKAALGLQ